MTLFLGPAHLERLNADGHVAMSDYVSAVEAAFAEHGRGEIGVVPRAVLAADPSATTTRTRSLKLSASYLRGTKLIGASVYTALFRPGDVDMWLTLFSGETGRMLGIVHGKSVSLWKTAATAAVATRHLARSNSSHAALIGTGRYALHQALALAAVRPIRSIACAGRDTAHSHAFASRIREALPNIDVRVAESVRVAIDGADVATTITTAIEPIIEGQWLTAGVHMNVMGAHDPGEREVDTDGVLRSRVFVDADEQAFTEKGELLIPLAAGEMKRDHVAGELGAVVSGRTIGRRAAKDVTMFLSGGTALEYTRICDMLIRRASEVGIGQQLEV
ncbi:MAG: hypothetical protein ABIU95_04090 [Burkholderiales bacterium]